MPDIPPVTTIADAPAGSGAGRFDEAALDPAIPPFAALAEKLAYLKPEELNKVHAAWVLAIQAHDGQRRASGEPYVTHPIAVTGIVAEWKLDAQAICAALLHDTLEDTGVSKQTLTDRFGATVADLVDGLSKLDKLEFKSAQEAQAENFRKMLMAMSRDLRVILIKLADRQHNMQTLGAMRAEKRRRIAIETLEIYAPIAHRLGLARMCHELEDLCFAQTHPLRCKVLAKAVRTARGHRAELLTKIENSIRHKLELSKIEGTVEGRQKTVFSIYRKMREKRLSFSQVLDIFGIRVVVEDAPHCYLALGVLHALYKPIPGKFKDYVAIPKANGYQSLHTTLIGPYGTPLEVQIRTREMQQVAHEGVAAHWLYKRNEGGGHLAAKTTQWLQSLLDLQKGTGDSREFLEHVKVDLFPDEVYVFSPKGKIFALPRGATAVDFAYAVHTDVGHCCTAARINGELMPLKTELTNGDRVEVLTAAEPNPNPDWLSYVTTARARSKIRHFLKTKQHDESARLGERFLEQALRPLGGTLAIVGDPTWEKLLHEAGAKSRADLLADIGLGRRNAALDARRLMVLGQFEPRAQSEQAPVPVTGEESAAMHRAVCCRPIPGDEIVGVVNQGHGIVIHAEDCLYLKRHKPSRDRMLPVEWDVSGDRLFDVTLRVQVENIRGVLAKVAAAIAEAGSNIENVAMDERKPDAVTTLNFAIEVSNRQHLAGVVKRIRRVPEVIRVARERKTSA